MMRNSPCFDYYKQTKKIALIKEKINHQDSDFNKANWSNFRKQNKAKALLNQDHNVGAYAGGHSPSKDPDY